MLMHQIRSIRPYTESVGHARSVVEAEATSLVLLMCGQYGWACVSHAVFGQARHGFSLVCPDGYAYAVGASGQPHALPWGRRRRDGTIRPL